jgi:hypothetical protein
MNYAFEMGAGAMIYRASFIKIGSAIQNLIGEIHIQTHRQQGDLISLFLFFQNKESRLIIQILYALFKMLMTQTGKHDQLVAQ